MSAKNLDSKGRYRSETIAYRCSPEERKELDKRWKLMGYLTKQDYVLDAVLHNKVTAKGNPQMLVNFRKELYIIISELERINEASDWQIREREYLSSTMIRRDHLQRLWDILSRISLRLPWRMSWNGC